MNRLIISLTILMAVVLVAPAAWTGEHPARTDQYISHQDLSPAVFFGYTDQDKTAESTRDSVERVADEKRTDVLKDAETRHQDMSPAEFFGYASHNTVAEKAVMNSKNPAKMTAADCRCDRTTDLKNSSSMNHSLSPAEFFYDIPQSNTKINPCTHC
ncbi:MAG: hypothetical protein WA081_02215 [Desulfosalsimonadaceae bacterium]